MSSRVGLIGVFAGTVLAMLAASIARGEGLDVGARRELFVDRYLIDKLTNAELRLQTPQPAEVAIRFDRRWEGRYCAYVTVIKDGATYRMYYRGLPEARHAQDVEVTCYAESSDGVRWTKPNLGLVDVAGTRENNVILRQAGEACHNFSPFLDTRPVRLRLVMKDAICTPCSFGSRAGALSGV
jgi:hypothetical protein